MKRIVYLCLIWISPLAAEPIIEVSGNSKTRTAYIEKLTRVCLQDAKKEPIPYARQDLRNEVMKVRIRQCLLNSNLFSQVMVTAYSEAGEAADGVENIQVEVTDKFSQIILPTYQQSQVVRDTLWGALFYDANFAGLGHSAGFLYTHQQEDKRDSYSLFYDMPYIDQQAKHGFTLIAFKRDSDFYSYVKDDWTYRTREKFQFLWLRAAYHINQEVSLFYGWAPSIFDYSNSVAQAEPDQSGAADQQYVTQTVNLGMRWDRTNNIRYYEQGARLQQTYYQQLSRTDGEDISAAYLFDFYWGLPVVSQHVFTLRLLGGTRSRVNEVDNLHLGAEHGSRGIPNNGAWNTQYLTSALDYQFPLVRGQYGYWTLGPFVDYGYQWGVFHHPKQEFGYYATGLASYVYLRRVNAPAIGVFFSNNSEYLENFISFYIGFQI